MQIVPSWPGVVTALLFALAAGGEPSAISASAENEQVDLAVIVGAASSDAGQSREALKQLSEQWRDGYAAMLIDLARLMRPDRTRSPGSVAGLAEAPGGASGPAARRGAGSPVRRRLIRFLESQTGKRFGDDLDRWRGWIWSQEYDPHPEYAIFKGGLYGRIDPRMREFFPPGGEASVRLDEIDWGGVRVNGIPPLDQPAHIPAAEAGYLAKNNVVFGVVVNGRARAYPRRIVAWHEMVRDRLGDVPLALVYCTLCGSVIPYNSEVAGRTLTFGTSGLLYRSNKLMFDEETNSLWSSLYGRPVVGPLVRSGLELERLPVVTTTWGEWREEHPETTVLSLDTGFDRDYDEGVAYREYWATDDLMFEVPQTDARLPNKAEVLVLGDPEAVRNPVALASGFLRENPVYMLTRGAERFVVLTSPRGAHRVYRAGNEAFLRWSDSAHVEDSAGRRWAVSEDGLTHADAPPFRRVPAHRVFWFAWFAQHPKTMLIP